jgi:hypothetical protein
MVISFFIKSPSLDAVHFRKWFSTPVFLRRLSLLRARRATTGMRGIDRIREFREALG